MLFSEIVCPFMQSMCFVRHPGKGEQLSGFFARLLSCTERVINFYREIVFYRQQITL